MKTKNPGTKTHSKPPALPARKNSDKPQASPPPASFQEVNRLRRPKQTLASQIKNFFDPARAQRKQQQWDQISRAEDKRVADWNKAPVSTPMNAFKNADKIDRKADDDSSRVESSDESVSDDSIIVGVSDDSSDSSEGISISAASTSSAESFHENKLYEGKVRGGDNPFYVPESDRPIALAKVQSLERNQEAYVKARSQRMSPAEQGYAVDHLLDTIRSIGAKAADIKRSIPIAAGSEKRIAQSVLDSLSLSHGRANSELTDKEITYSIATESVSGYQRDFSQKQLPAVIGPVAKRFRPEACNKLADVLVSAVNEAGIQSQQLSSREVKSLGWTFERHEDGGLKASYKMQFQVNGSSTMAEVNGSVELDEAQNPVLAATPVISLPETVGASRPRNRGQIT